MKCHHQGYSTCVKAMMRGRYSWRALSKASLASSASFCAFVAATTDALASVMLPLETGFRNPNWQCRLIFTYQILIVKQGTLRLEQQGKDFVLFLLQLVFSLQCLMAHIRMGMILISHLVPQEAALVLQLLFVNVDQALQHVGFKKLGAHLEVDNL